MRYIFIYSNIQFRTDGHFGKINIILPVDVAETSGSNWYFLNPKNIKKDQSELTIQNRNKFLEQLHNGVYNLNALTQLLFDLIPIIVQFVHVQILHAHVLNNLLACIHKTYADRWKI